MSHQTLAAALQISYKVFLGFCVWRLSAVSGAGWSKFASNVVMISREDAGPVVAMLAPVLVTLDHIILDVSTEYPFGDTVTVTANVTGGAAVPVHIRIPGMSSLLVPTTNSRAVMQDGPTEPQCQSRTWHKSSLARFPHQMAPCIQPNAPQVSATLASRAFCC